MTKDKNILDDLSRDLEPSSFSDLFTRYPFRYPWKKFFQLFSIPIIITALFAYAFQWYFPIYIVLILLIWQSFRRIKAQQQLTRLEHSIFPVSIWQHVQQQHGTISSSQQQWIEAGFKDFLALQILKRGYYIMPSKAVDEFWHLYLEHEPTHYQKMCQHILGFELKHVPHATELTAYQRVELKRKTLQTWHCSCELQRIATIYGLQRPRLFQIDQMVQWVGGFYISTEMIRQFQQAESQGADGSGGGDSSNSDSSDCDSSCSSCGGGCGGGGD